ncbi:unnamed protein product [Zymoseptoria tritici ST99CH_1A5]|uniref:Translation initiation factor eIF2B subunit beta n=1 Tax=Zymoseptoria tritici ST99CH_1A5 TaxID=1276529 RepID=A0A1Y6M088_ZYMTR|nr:unnamed protein product [Zymoseptoria tritici ST99CH_3D1]SMY29279.1 unnamed protein product [Zymoseptoria tritici ST99CH_1A5]
MPSAVATQAPSLTTFLKSHKSSDIESSIELLISLLKRRQIRNSRPCAIATAQLLLRVVGEQRWKDAETLIQRVRQVGRRLTAAQPREMAVGNIVRRILGIVREITEDNPNEGHDEGLPAAAVTGESFKRASLSSKTSGFTPLPQGTPPRKSMSPPSIDGSFDHTQRPSMPAPAGSLFGIFQQPGVFSSNAGSPLTSGTASPIPHKQAEAKVEKIDIKAEVIDGIKDLLEELDIVDTQIAESALDHIHSNEIILTHTSSQTVQKFLAAAARKRSFTVVHAEAYPNDHLSTHATIVNGSTASAEDDSMDRWKPLTSLGIKVILIPDTAVFALMSRINKVILAPHTVLANGSLIAAAGASAIAQAAQMHRVPVVVLSGVYKLSPVYPFDSNELLEYGDPSKVVGFDEGGLVGGVDVVNPVFDHVGADLVDLYVTNLGGCAPSFLYRIVADHYRGEDVDL